MGDESIHSDVIIVGARIAGSLLANLMAQQGHQVLVLDRAKFPSDTLSTHFFRAPAFRVFKAAGVLDEVLATAPQLKVNYNVIDGVVFPEPVDRPDDYPFYMCVRRITLDHILVRRVKTFENITLMEGAKAEELIRKDGRVTGVRWSDGNEKHEAFAKAIVGADGLNSFVAKSVNAISEQEEPINRTMYYAYYKDVVPNDGPAAEFHYRENNLMYCFPTDGDLTLIAASAPVSNFPEFKRDPEGRLEQEIRSMVALADRVDPTKREGLVRGTASIPGRLRIPYGDGWALVGDAGMVLDPWSGQGIDQASTHANFLAQELHDFLIGSKDWETSMRNYHKLRNDFSMKTFQRTCAYSRDLRPMTHTALETRGLLK